jgi:hypothetical protein
MSAKFQISRDSPALYITVVAKDRLPVFKSDAIKLVTCQALDEARKSGGFLLFAYVLMLTICTPWDGLPQEFCGRAASRERPYCAASNRLLATA